MGARQRFSATGEHLYCLDAFILPPRVPGQHPSPHPSVCGDTRMRPAKALTLERLILYRAVHQKQCSVSSNVLSAPGRAGSSAPAPAAPGAGRGVPGRCGHPAGAGARGPRRVAPGALAAPVPGAQPCAHAAAAGRRRRPRRVRAVQQQRASLPRRGGAGAPQAPVRCAARARRARLQAPGHRAHRCARPWHLVPKPTRRRR